MIAFLLKANWKRATWYDGRSEIQIPRGSFVTSYPKMAQFCNLTPKQVRLAFDHLEHLHFAAYRRAPKWTMVTILNYGTYQDAIGDEGTVEGSLRARSGHDEGTTRAPIEEGNKVRSKNTPPAADAYGAGAPLVLIPPDPNEETRGATSRRKPFGDVLLQVAKAIHDRHPNAYSRRDLGVDGVEKKLAAILKYKRIPTSEVETYLRRIDRNHGAACASEMWQKNGGEFVKSLRGWLAPREERYEVEPANPARKEPVRLLA
jgi:hypothetical protein